MDIKYNIGSTDRIVYALGGAVLAIVGVVTLAGTLDFGTAAVAVALLIGTVLLETVLTRTCLLYRILGVDTSESA